MTEVSAPTIYRLSIERFRGIQRLSWQPFRGVNLILGGGDAGKTTLLDAVSLLFNPTNSAALFDTDYYNRKVEDGFLIEAIVALPPTCNIGKQAKPSWPWIWNGTDISVPALEDEQPTAEPVYRLRVQGTPDLELSYEILQPDNSADHFAVAIRRSIGLVRLSGDDRNDRDLKLVQGSALDHLLSDPALRSRLAKEFGKTDVKEILAQEKQVALSELNIVFKAQHLPSDLNLAATGGQGFSIAALIGLTAKREDTQLPLPSWGAGTRRIAALTIAEQNQGEAPITIVDEIERGLEPYRQSTLMTKLQEGNSQAFVTTHSPATIAAASRAGIWYIDHAGQIGSLDSSKIANLRARDPESFLARLTIVAEGLTEMGFVTTLLDKTLLQSSIAQCGIHISDGAGHEQSLGVLEALSQGGLSFAGFADNEDGKHPARWQTVSTKLGDLLFRWKSGCLESNIIASVSDDHLEQLITDPDGNKTGKRLRTLADRLGITDKSFVAVSAAAGTNLRALILEAALGKVPTDKEAQRKEYRAHATDWFKSSDGGSELAEKMFKLALWETFKPQLLPFFNAVRTAVGLSVVEDINF